MVSYPYTVAKQRFLGFISAVYFFAFVSTYIQLPELPSDFIGVISDPNLLMLSPLLKLDGYVMLELVLLIGAFLAMITTFSTSFRSAPAYLFMWDKLLLESGFLCILATLTSFFTFNLKSSASDRIVIWLIKWLLFRVVFSHGVKKLLSDCPYWWSLKALDWHYQSHPLPSSVSWFVANISGWQRNMISAFILFTEIVLPFCFLVPLKGVTRLSCMLQILLQCLNAATGNYGFYNVIVVGLCLSVMAHDRPGRRSKSKLTAILSFLTIITVVGSLAFLISFKLDSSATPVLTLAFTKVQFHQFVHHAIIYTSYAALFMFASQGVFSLITALKQDSFLRRNGEMFGVLAVGTIGLLLVFSSLVPFSYLDKTTKSHLPPQVAQIHQQLAPYHLTNSYGIMRRTTGIGGRPEIILEGSKSPDGPWKEYHFRFKPGRLDRMPPFVAPHQPRLDWQMSTAALDKLETQPFMSNLVYRLLAAEPDVIALLDTSVQQPINSKYIRARTYLYQFTEKPNDVNWWSRVFKAEYMPAVSLTSPSLRKTVERTGLIGKRRQRPEDPTQLSLLLKQLRTVIGQQRDLYPLLFVFLLILLTKLAWAQSSSR